MTRSTTSQHTIEALQATVARAETREDLAAAETALALEAARLGVDVECSRCGEAIAPRASAPHAWCAVCAAAHETLLGEVRTLLLSRDLEGALDEAQGLEVHPDDLQREIARAVVAYVSAVREAILDRQASSVGHCLDEARRIARALAGIPLPAQDPAVGSTPPARLAAEILVDDMEAWRPCAYCDTAAGSDLEHAVVEVEVQGQVTALCASCWEVMQGSHLAQEGSVGEPEAIEVPEWVSEAVIVEVAGQPASTPAQLDAEWIGDRCDHCSTPLRCDRKGDGASCPVCTGDLCAACAGGWCGDGTDEGAQARRAEVRARREAGSEEEA